MIFYFMKAALTKCVVLTVTLVLPVGVYLFLKNFGENKYAIPVYYQEEAEKEVSECFEFSIPHSVNLSVYQSFSDNVPGGIAIINPVFDACFDCPPNLNEIKRIVQRHPDINVVNLYVGQLTSYQSSITNQVENWLVKEVELPDMISILRCQLLIDIPSKTSVIEMNETNQLVLIDAQNRIRGYYNKNDREDIDRLILEISILKQE